jgi:hypothetical protein
MWTDPAIRTPHDDLPRGWDRYYEYENRRTFVVSKTYIICGVNPAMVPSDT